MTPIEIAFLVFLLMAMTSMRVTAVCFHGDSGFNVNLAHGKKAMAISNLVFLAFFASIGLGFWVLPLLNATVILVAALFIPVLFVRPSNLEKWVKGKPYFDILTLLVCVAFWVMGLVG
jgi:hypothetical protein